MKITILLLLAFVAPAYGQLYEPVGGDGNIEPINPGLYDQYQPNYTGQFGAGQIGTYPQPRGSTGFMPRQRRPSQGLVPRDSYGCSGVFCD